MKELARKLRSDINECIQKKNGERVFVLEMVLKYLASHSPEFGKAWEDTRKIVLKVERDEFDTPRRSFTDYTGPTGV